MICSLGVFFRGPDRKLIVYDFDDDGRQFELPPDEQARRIAAARVEYVQTQTLEN